MAARLLAITQRVSLVPGRTEVRDSLDQAWATFLSQCGFDFIAVPNQHDDPVEYVRSLGVEGIILSGGGNVSPHLGTISGGSARVPERQEDIAFSRDRTETALLKASLQQGWPVLGVCRGMQAINLFHDGTICATAGHVGTQHAIKPTPFAQFIYPSTVNSFHNFAVVPEGLGTGLVAEALAGSEIEAFSHRQFRHRGIMWHPERVQEFSPEDVYLFRHFFRE